MKKPTKLFTHIIAIIALSFAFSGCEKIKEAAEIDVPFDVTANFQVDNSTFASRDGEPIMYQGNFDFDFQDLKDSYGIDGLEEASFNTATLEIISPAGVDFGWLNTSSLTIKTSTLPEKTIASYTKVAGVTNPITLSVQASDISSYLEAGSYTLTVYGSANTPLPQSPITLKLVAGGNTVVRPI